MSSSTSEQVLRALFQMLQSNTPEGAKLLRNEAYPERISEAGILILRDGDPGEPQVTLSPPSYLYEHRAEVDLLVEARKAEARDANFDALKQTVGAAIASDRSLGGLCDYLEAGAPAPIDLALEGTEAVKAASITIKLIYASADPLA
ncbi:hypothetical protein PsAD13_01409 [Pseudovibrio sp. Ad13]|uniref:hypothetical protein n=1 Tax=Pseudovibrio sp. Ad13 TaxID=989396 RepID=UPI0007AE51E4|nr:hypothetical protein [Pseudovibrio sp. Ad13]KZK84876.1 hypothetical protein PsAD13_01409 [Pseudovibrio sp. Ad13]